ncbi:MAG TPA: zinc-binding dehydrogenase, partial [bacterium]|nr:zinc-binding dehydrogenase [bacterium]
RHAEDLGAVWTGGLQDDPGEKMDAILNFTPAGNTVIDGLKVLRKGGTQVCAGIHMSDIPQMPYQLIYGERTLRSVANSTRRDGRELLELAAKIPIRTNVEIYSLEKANEVLNLMKQSEIRGAAVLQIAEK